MMSIALVKHLQDWDDAIVSLQKAEDDFKNGISHKPFTLLRLQDAVKKAKDKFLRTKFDELTALWKKDTSYLSQMSKILSHPAYLGIVGMGPDVLPFIFEDLEKTHYHWFSALRKITGANPVPLDLRGNIQEMTRYWLEWAADHGFSEEVREK